MSARRLLVLSVVLALLGAAVGGCGSGSGSGTASTPASGPKNPRSSRAAYDIVLKSAAALKRVHSYHAAGVSVDKDGRTRLVADVSDDGRLRVTTRSRDGVLSLIVIGRDTYVKGDRRFWITTSGVGSGLRAADLFAGRWVKAPPSFGAPFLKTVKELLPKTFAHCLPQKLGTLSITGTRTYRGQRVTVVADEGDVAGGTPSEMWFAAKGAPLPARGLSHGLTRQGGGYDPLCDEPDDTTTRSSYRFGQYDSIRKIVPPANPLDLGKLRGQEPGGRSA